MIILCANTPTSSKAETHAHAIDEIAKNDTQQRLRHAVADGTCTTSQGAQGAQGAQWGA